MPANQIRDELPRLPSLFFAHSGQQNSSQDRVAETTVEETTSVPKPCLRVDLGEGPFHARCARMTLLHALTLIVDV